MGLLQLTNDFFQFYSNIFSNYTKFSVSASQSVLKHLLQLLIFHILSFWNTVWDRFTGLMKAFAGGWALFPPEFMYLLDLLPELWALVMPLFRRNSAILAMALSIFSCSRLSLNAAYLSLSEDIFITLLPLGVNSKPSKKQYSSELTSTLLLAPSWNFLLGFFWGDHPLLKYWWVGARVLMTLRIQSISTRVASVNPIS